MFRSEYQRFKTPGNSHNKGISLESFSMADWINTSTFQAKRFATTCNLYYESILSFFNTSNYMFISYDDLLAKETRVYVLRNIVNFIDVRKNVSNDR